MNIYIYKILIDIVLFPTSKFLYEHWEGAIQMGIYSTLYYDSAMNVKNFTLIQIQKSIRDIQMKGGLQFYLLIINQQ